MESMDTNPGVSSSTQNIFCWGCAASGQLGIQENKEENITKPTLLPYFQDRVKEIVSGKEHTIFLLENGLVYSCGSNTSKQLGHSKGGMEPAKIELLENMSVEQVSCGGDHTVVLNSKNQLLAFGSNSKGQLGAREDRNIYKPRLIKRFLPSLGNAEIMQVVCGAEHCLALSSNGTIYSWGDNEHGQLGNGRDKAFMDTPRKVTALSNLPIYMIAAGGSHSFALTISGTLFGWGKNRFGQLGNGNEEDKPIPVRVDSLRSKFVRYVCCGEEHTVALTKLGQVFTFGCGSSGQLGHAGTEKATHPRQVMELMGSTVTQVACGRWHTLAYIESTKHLYSFGQNKFGQLGTGSLDAQKTPSIVDAQWTKFQNSSQMNGVNEAAVDEMEIDYSEHGSCISKIYCGGSQNFVIVENHLPPIDMTNFVLEEKTTKFLTESKVQQLIQDCQQTEDEALQHRALSTVATIFSTPACLNLSFLNRNLDEETSLSNHGLDISLMRRSFVRLVSIESIREKIFSSYQHLLNDLKSVPADFEALRIYLMLPEIAIYERPYKKIDFISTAAEQILKLHGHAQQVLCHWWAKLPGSFFSRVIKAFKLCVEHAMEKCVPGNIVISNGLVAPLIVLQLLNRVNNEANGIVPYDQFYIPIIQQKIDIAEDYKSYLHFPNRFAFSGFLFVFDVQAKARLLETDARIKMEQQIQRTCEQNILNMQLFGLDPSNPNLVFHVRRDRSLLVQDTLRAIEQHRSSAAEFQKPLKIVFVGEEGIDAGGPKKEFFLLLIKEIFDRKYGMFVEIESSRTVWFNPQSYEDPAMYFLIGLICGLALYNSIIIDIHFPLVFYKKLLDQETNLEDFRGFDPDYARTLQYLLDYEGDVENTFLQNFQVLEIVYDEEKKVDLIENGDNILVNAENREKYVDLLVDYKLNKSVAKQFEQFKNGFYEICDRSILGFWHPQELMEMIAGRENYDNFMSLRTVTTYEGEYYNEHPVINRFWEVLQDFNVEMRRQFLAFLTGSDKIPVSGFKSLTMRIDPLGSPRQQNLLPEASTCFNILYLPRYDSKEVMERKVILALTEFNKGFGME